MQQADTTLGIFIDIENVTDWVQSGLPPLMEKLHKKGNLLFRKAYGKWSNPQLQGFQKLLNQHGFELIHHYHPVNGKNSADIQMTVDVMFCACQMESPDYFVLISNDSDFSPLYRRLREMGKYIIGVAKESPLSQSVASSCHEFIYISQKRKVTKKKKPVSTPPPPTSFPKTSPVISPIPKTLKEARTPSQKKAFYKSFPQDSIKGWISCFIQSRDSPTFPLHDLQTLLKAYHSSERIKNTSVQDLTMHLKGFSNFKFYHNRNDNLCIWIIPDDFKQGIQQQEQHTENYYKLLLHQSHFRWIDTNLIEQIHTKLTQHKKLSREELEDLTQTNLSADIRLLQEADVLGFKIKPGLPPIITEIQIKKELSVNEILKKIDQLLIEKLLKQLMRLEETIDEAVIEKMLRISYSPNEYLHLFTSAQEKVVSSPSQPLTAVL